MLGMDPLSHSDSTSHDGVVQGEFCIYGIRTNGMQHISRWIVAVLSARLPISNVNNIDSL